MVSQVYYCPCENDYPAKVGIPSEHREPRELSHSRRLFHLAQNQHFRERGTNSRGINTCAKMAQGGHSRMVIKQPSALVDEREKAVLRAKVMAIRSFRASAKITGAFRA